MQTPVQMRSTTFSTRRSIDDVYEKEMDLHNNSIGYHLGNQAIINGWSEEELLNQVIDAADNGRLKILE